MNKDTNGPFQSRRRRSRMARVTTWVIVAVVVIFLLFELQEFAHLNFGRFYFPR